MKSIIFILILSLYGFSYLPSWIFGTEKEEKQQQVDYVVEEVMNKYGDYVIRIINNSSHWHYCKIGMEPISVKPWSISNWYYSAEISCICKI